MRWTRSAAMLAVSAAAMSVAACGAGTAPGAARTTSAAATPAPQTAVLTAVRRTVSDSVRADFSTDVTFTGTQAITVHADMQVTEENAQRISVTLTGYFLGQQFSDMVVAYDGSLYESVDAGHTFKRIPAHVPLDDTYNQEDALNAIEAVYDVSDQGSEVTDGLTVEEYSGTLDRNKLEAVVQARLHKLGVNTAEIAKELSSLTGSIDATIDGSGRLVTEEVTFDTTMHCGCGRTVALHEDVRGHFYDYGAAITVPRPA
jgi:hypothetical protein